MPRWTSLVRLEREQILAHAPQLPGIYEIGYWVEPTYFVPRYLGRARGASAADQTGTTIRMRLLKHGRNSHNQHIRDALAGSHDPEWLIDPDAMAEGARLKMKIDKSLWCRWMVSRASDEAWGVSAKREADLLRRWGVGEAQFALYVWNQRF